MEVIIRPTTEDAVKLTAKLICDAVVTKKDLVMGLATGRTMEAVYAEMARLNSTNYVDFSQCRSFNLDEYIGLAPTDKNSYRYYMNYHLFDRININKNNTSLPNGLAEDVEAEGGRYEWAIQAAGGIDLQLLGIGEDGHIGFNEPLSSLASQTRAKTLTPETYKQNSPLFDNPEDMPMRAFTMGVGTILNSKRIVMLVTGAGKADILAKAVEGPITSMISATAIQMHRDVVVIVDEAAASKLQGQEYYKWIFEHEPKWEKYHNI